MLVGELIIFITLASSINAYPKGNNTNSEVNNTDSSIPNEIKLELFG
jgi:hypothetical protein